MGYIPVVGETPPSANFSVVPGFPAELSLLWPEGESVPAWQLEVEGTAVMASVDGQLMTVTLSAEQTTALVGRPWVMVDGDRKVRMGGQIVRWTGTGSAPTSSYKVSTGGTQVTVAFAAAGPAGPIGPVSTVPGPPGPAFNPNGTVPSGPPSGTGVAGDFFVANDTGRGWVWVEADSEWQDIGEIRGPQGPAPAVDQAANVGSSRTLGTGALQAAAGNDSRLSNQRTPTDATVTPAKFAAAAIDPAANVAGARTLGTGALQAAPGTLATTVAGKETTGVAASLVNALPELAEGADILVDDTSTAGFVLLHNKGRMIPGAELVQLGGSSTAEVNLVSATTELAANYFNANSMYRLDMSGTLINNSGSAANITLRFKLGGTTIYQFAFAALPTFAALRRWMISATFKIYSFSGTRIAGIARCNLSAPGAGGTGGLDYGAITAVAEAVTINETTVLPVTVTTQSSVSHANINTTFHGGSLRRIRNY